MLTFSRKEKSMLVNQIVPRTAGEMRRKEFNSPFNRHVGINIKSFTTNKDAFIVTATPSETASNIHGQVVHGGWTATYFDTVLSGVVHSDQAGSLKDEEYALTQKLDIKFNAPLFVGQTYSCEGKITEREGNNIQTEASVIDSQGKEVATATALVKARRADYRSPILNQIRHCVKP